MAVLSAQFFAHLAGIGYDCIPLVEVDAALSYAARRCPHDVWRNRHIDGVCFLTAHLLAERLEEYSQLAATGAQDAEGKERTARAPYGGESMDALKATFPGREYLHQRTLVVGLTAAVCGVPFP